MRGGGRGVAAPPKKIICLNITTLCLSVGYLSTARPFTDYGPFCLYLVDPGLKRHPYTNTNKEKFGSFVSRALAYEVNGFPR